MTLIISTALAVFQPLNICIVLSLYFLWTVVYALYFSPLRNVPGSLWQRISILPMRFHDLCGSERDFMLNNYKTYGSIFVIEPQKVGLCDYNDCMVILGSHSFLKDLHYSRVDFIEPNTFLTRDPEMNRIRRRQIGPALATKNLLNMESSIFAAGIQQLMEKWDRAIAESSDGKARICYFYDFLLMAFDIISSLGFGQEHRSLTTGDRRIVEWVRQSFLLMLMQMVAPLVKRRPFKQIFASSLYSGVREFIEFGSKAIEQRKKDLAASGGANKPKDILQSFVDAEDPVSRIRMTPSQVTTETIIGLLAGADTGSNTLCWTLHLLLLHPKYLRQVKKEVRSAFEYGRLIMFSEAKEKLLLLEACIYESMRLRPVSGDLPRCIPAGGVVLQKLFIPEGYTCSVAIAAANMNATTWEKPYVFYPERFVGNNANKRMMLTFSAGVRVCPGRHLAWLEMLTTLANILNSYEFEIPNDALFTPHRRDKRNQPIIMPHTTAITCAPKFHDRDCVVIVSKRKL
ncbi:cytochrome P450 [Coemansia reversa NRRL 1564]|uniref:Cytochrome P450 n=1 Tax=Coemansia reversa (strain ATCC 12441 / NRRL 1564) TaxID=763665 RepID=A0A2G5B5M8_COERN|nr:cytochrome P450 [Coemansia reversa NRRL 1564]|eukprot:PIA14027.1 cytochrome P450 [Coemansia reversa NRRL 1564]